MHIEFQNPSSDIFPILTLFFGFALGLVGNILFENYKSKKLQKEVWNGVKQELREIKIRSAYFCFDISFNYGKKENFTLELIEYLRPYINEIWFSKEYEFIRIFPMPDEYKRMSNIHLHKTLLESQGNRNDVCMIPKLMIQYIDSNYSHISQLSKDKQLLINKIKWEIDICNWNIDQIDYFHKVGFSNISDIQNNNAIKNLFQKVEEIPSKYLQIIKLIILIESKK